MTPYMNHTICSVPMKIAYSDTMATVGACATAPAHAASAETLALLEAPTVGTSATAEA